MAPKYKKILVLFLLVLPLVLLTFRFSYASTYYNNSMEIEANPHKRSYKYGEDITINIKIKNKNRYAKLFYKVTDIYSGGGFSTVNLDSSERIVDSFGEDGISVKLKDNYYSEKLNKEIIDTHITFKNGYRPPNMSDEEYEEYSKYRGDKIVAHRLGKVLYEKESYTALELIKSKINATLLIVVIIIVVLVIFTYFIIKSKNKGGYSFKSIILFILGSGLIFYTILGPICTYAADIYQENVKYNKTISTTVEKYGIFSCTFDVKVEYYFINSIEPITDLDLDTDGDTLPDYLEVLYLTDLNNEDTDTDGLPDGVEVFRTFTDPLWTDTNGNDVDDGNEDYDQDKLTNLEEKSHGTDYDNADTDFDGLSDYDEINGVKTKNGLKTYETDPLSDDTDGDGLRDDTELKLNLNPTNPYDANTKVFQTISTSSIIPKELTIESSVPISFRGALVGDIEENLKVKKSSNWYYDSLESTVGNTIVVETSYKEGDGLIIVFDVSKYATIKDRLQVCKLMDGKLQVVSGTYMSGNNIISSCSSGEYVLIDSMKLLQDMNVFLN